MQSRVVVGAAFLAAFFVIRGPASSAMSDSCRTAPLVFKEDVHCLDACASGCQTLLPAPFPEAGLGATYTYCFCSSEEAPEPTCCHVVRVWLAGTFFVVQRGICGGSDCPGGTTCSVQTVNVGSPPQAASVGVCMTPP